MKIFIFSIGLLLHFVSYGQKTLFKQKNKILEFNYGVADSGGLERMNEMEKIKYELKFVEKTYRKYIFNDYTFETEIKIDSNDYEEAWMKLPNKFKYTFNGVSIYNKQGSFLKTIPCSQEQRDDLKSEKEAIKVAFEQHRKIYPKIAIEFLSVWDSDTKIEKYNDGSKRYQKYPC
jgi:hypothetical protein